jgi:selenide,water dikinase
VDLAQVLGRLPPNDDPRVLADYRGASDAGVFLLNDRQALVQTVDFLTPILDDPADFGQVAAANALSDLYAMGATPCTALSVVGFPKKGLDFSLLAEMLEGGHQKLHEAGAVLLGGHTVQDPEIKLGYAVTGTIRPEDLVTNRAARPGDLLYLTKPIGTGVLATALKKGKLDADAQAALTRSLVSLNRGAAEAMVEVGVQAATDITGFGLLGHAAEVARASRVRIEISAESVPLLPQARWCQSKGFITGGVEPNRRYVADLLEVGRGVDPLLRDLLFDPQTSGGLLIAVAQRREEALRSALSRRGGAAARIGRVAEEGTPRLVVI